MLKKIKVKKIAVVVFLTLLIWVWADLALDTTKPFYNATISISKTSNPDLWISFNEKSSINIKKFDLKGSVSKINQAEDAINKDPAKLNFTFVPEQMGITKSGTLPVWEILNKSDWIRDMGLSVVEESCDPCEVSVNVVDLVPRDLTVQCFNQNNELIKAENVEPETVEMLVPESWLGERQVARVILSPADILKARSEIIEKTPQITLASGQQPRLSATTVKIKMPPEADLRQPRNVKDPTLGYCFSPNLQGQYMVEVDNLPEINTISIKATDVAKLAYESMLFQVILEIGDDDVPKAEGGQEIRKEVIYNFPRGFGEDEIQLVDSKTIARFKLIKIPSVDN